MHPPVDQRRESRAEDVVPWRHASGCWLCSSAAVTPSYGHTIHVDADNRLIIGLATDDLRQGTVAVDQVLPGTTVGRLDLWGRHDRGRSPAAATAGLLGWRVNRPRCAIQHPASGGW